MKARVILTRTVEKNFTIDRYHSRAFDLYFGNASVCALDIETTDLSPDRSRFVLGGLLVQEETSATLKQFFAEDPAEERLLLSLYLEEAAKVDALITYNGARFDLPFLRARAERHGLPAPDFPYHFDLYSALNRFSSLRKILPNLKQKTVENFMGLWHLREDEISGGDSARLYQEYLRAAANGADTERAVETMLLHNRDDVLQLARLLPALEKADLHGAMRAFGFSVPAAGGRTALVVEKIEIGADFLSVSGRQRADAVDFIAYGDFDDDVFVKFDKADGRFFLKFRIIRESGLALLDLAKRSAPLREKMAAYPNRGDDYLVLENRRRVNHAEVNAFVIHWLQELDIFTLCPPGGTRD